MSGSTILLPFQDGHELLLRWRGRGNLAYLASTTLYIQYRWSKTTSLVCKFFDTRVSTGMRPHALGGFDRLALRWCKVDAVANRSLVPQAQKRQSEMSSDSSVADCWHACGCKHRLAWRSLGFALASNLSFVGMNVTLQLQPPHQAHNIAFRFSACIWLNLVGWLSRTMDVGTALWRLNSLFVRNSSAVHWIRVADFGRRFKLRRRHRDSISRRSSQMSFIMTQWLS